MTSLTVDPRTRCRLAAIGALAAASLGAPSAGLALEVEQYDAPRYQPADPYTEDFRLYSDAELEELVGAVALYPDDLLAIVLPASTYPLQVVEAARFLEQAERDDIPPAHWDDSVVALLNYPEVVALLNDDLDQTWRLGEAVINQRPDVLAAIERFRERAYAAGNLRSDEHQVVQVIDEYIQIEPADPEVIYVPYYEPARVIVYQPIPVYRYYPRPYPVYYYPYPAGYRFRSGLFWGVTTWFSIGWSTLHIHVHDHHHARHPFHGRYFYEPYYRHRNHYTYMWQPSRDHHHDPLWTPGPRHGSRPVRNDEPRRGHDGRTTASTANNASTANTRRPAADERHLSAPRNPSPAPAAARRFETDRERPDVRRSLTTRQAGPAVRNEPARPDTRDRPTRVTQGNPADARQRPAVPDNPADARSRPAAAPRNPADARSRSVPTRRVNTGDAARTSHAREQPRPAADTGRDSRARPPGQPVHRTAQRPPERAPARAPAQPDRRADTVSDRPERRTGQRDEAANPPRRSAEASTERSAQPPDRPSRGKRRTDREAR